MSGAYTIDDILSFLEQQSRAPAEPDNDLQNDLGITGDDWFEIIDAYAKEYNVDISNCLWYFHNSEEGHDGLGQIFFKPPNKRVKYIPVTPNMLLDFANKGKWDIDYPEHSIPEKRHDLTINTILGIIILLWLTLYIINKLFF